MKWLLLLLISPVLLAADNRGVLVSGSCQIKVVPDRGSVTFTAENQKKDQKEAVKLTHNQMNHLKEKIQKLKLADIEFKTTHYSVDPIREYEKNHYVNKGTKASMTLEITTSEISRLGETMVEASLAGIQNVTAMVTFLSLEKAQSEYLKCLDIASQDARKKAEQLAKKLDFSLGKVLNVVEAPVTTDHSPQPLRAQMFEKSSMTMDAAPVDAGTQNFSTNIQVTFEIK